VQGKGMHTVVLRFSVALPAGGTERELRFGVPELPQSRLTFRVPGKTGYLHAVEPRGAQHVSIDGDQLRLEADLGAVKSIAARWHKDEGPKPATVAQVKEAYYWTLQASSARLSA